MKHCVFCSIAIAALVLGCAGNSQHMGAAADNDQNVLTGGPITGTTLQDLPKAVKHTLKQRVPMAEIADINQIKHNGQIVYEISFTTPDQNPKMFITEDGRVLPESDAEKK